MRTPPDSQKESKAADNSCLLFDHEGSLFAVKTQVVHKIHWLPELTVVEGMPPFIVGVFDLQGELVPVLDINLRFGHSATPCRLTDCVVVIAVEHGLIGLIANEIVEMVDISPVVASLDSLGSDMHSLITEVEADGRIVMLLDHHQLMDSGEFEIMLSPTTEEGIERRLFFPQASEEERSILRGRADALRKQLVESDTEQHGLVVVSMDSEYFGFSLKSVREFADIGSVVPVPCCPPHIMGNMNFRGDIVTLVDMRSELHLSFNNAEQPARVVVSEQNHLLVGIPVDEIHEVIFVDSKEYRPVPLAVKGTDTDYIRGEVPYRDRMISVIDLEAFLDRPELIVDLEV
ncbi:MAG: chemotaxis protein CheW [Sedimenticola sp.]